MNKKEETTDEKRAKKREKIEYKSYSFIDKLLKRIGVKDEAKRKAAGGKISVCLTVVLLAAWVWVALQISILIVQGILALTRGAGFYQNMNQTLLELVLQAIVYTLALLVTIFGPWFALKKHIHSAKTTRNEMGLRDLMTWTDILLAIIGYIVSALVGGLLLIVCQALLPGINWNQAQEVGFQSIYTSGDMVMAFIALAVIAPICEELIFRGWLYGKLRARIPALPAIMVVSLLFAAVHGQFNVGVVVFCMSVANCLIRELTGTIYGGILVHIIRNAIAFYGLFVLGL